MTANLAISLLRRGSNGDEILHFYRWEDDILIAA